MSDRKTVLLLHVQRVIAGSSAGVSSYLGLFYLAGMLERSGYAPWVFHGKAHQVPEVLEREKAKGPISAVGLACDYENRTAVEGLCRWAKANLDCPVIVGGPQAPGLSEDFFLRSRCDYVVVGEAEETLPELLDCLLRGKGTVEEIHGVVWLDEAGKLRKSPPREPVADLDRLPFPAYHRSLHREAEYGQTLFTGRGCPFSCAFCYQSNHQRRVRLRAMKQVMAEIRSNLEQNRRLKYIIVSDDTFTLYPERVDAFCRGMDDIRQNRDLVWYCEGHVKLLARWPEMLQRMAQSGLVRLQIGIETGDQAVLDLYGKQVTVDEIVRVAQQAVEAGIPQLAANLIIGGPLEGNGETLERTAALAERLLTVAPGVIDISTGFLRPYPGTAIARTPGSFGLEIHDPDGSKSVDDFPLITPEGMTLEEVVSARLRISHHIVRVMGRLLREGKVADGTILSQYRLAERYGITSVWYTEFFSKDPCLHEYFRLLAKGAARAIEDVPPEEKPFWRPQRTMEIHNTVTFDAGYPRIGDYVFSPLEFELLLRCTAKATYQEVMDSLFRGFGDRYDDREDFDETVERIWREYDRRRWVVFCRR
ncbi:radical SAM protein [Heliobacterium undosum]|uniref:Radical SAM protein n=1 Tax=Heliomicrobium undosum TaxID=121734 RepID=A0A845L4F1_9FIRM|nr:radical SAM protein [Heliomicrobium undosum]MZP30586.1 radical SAM protein [Heliomicrobium undosum]